MHTTSVVSSSPRCSRSSSSAEKLWSKRGSRWSLSASKMSLWVSQPYAVGLVGRLVLAADAVVPEDRDERHPRLDQPPRQQTRLPGAVQAVALAHAPAARAAGQTRRGTAARRAGRRPAGRRRSSPAGRSASTSCGSPRSFRSSVRRSPGAPAAVPGTGPGPRTASSPRVTSPTSERLVGPAQEAGRTGPATAAPAPAGALMWAAVCGKRSVGRTR